MKTRLKRLLFLLLAVVITVGLVACGGGDDKKSAVQEAIAKAEKMTEAELLEAAKAEIGDGKLSVQSQTSGTAKALKKFKEKYGIDYNEEDANNTKKDYQLYTALDVVATGQYYTDSVTIQDVRSLQQYINEGILFTYAPKDINLDAEDKQPLSSIYYNKLFLHNKKDTDFTISNVWQVAGSAEDEGHIDKLSFQNPSTENINMNFLLSLTSPRGINLLTEAYKDFYGVDYDGSEDNYANIGYKYIAEFLKNVKTYHTSDTTTIKEVIPADNTEQERVIVYGAFAKYKDLIKALNNDAEEAAEVLAWEMAIKGFKGFLYKMYTVIPATAKYPYTACLFHRYLLTEEGFAAGWGGQYGYYSANPEVPIHEGDKPLSYWKETCIIEDGQYLSTVKNSLVSFIQSNIK